VKKMLVAFALVAGSLGFAVAHGAARQLLCPGVACTVVVSGGAPHGRSVAVVGDSITYLSSPDIRGALRDYQYTIHATGGQTMAQMYPVIRQLASAPRHAWVVELGTNDALGSNPTWSAAFDAEVTTLASQPCVVLVSVNPRLGPTAVSLDRAISSVVLGHRNFHLLDWGTIEWQEPKWVSADGIHPDPQGSRKLAQLMKQSIHSSC